MSVTVTRYPTANAAPASSAPYDDMTWTNYNNLKADDSTYANIIDATFDTGKYSYIMKFSHFDAAIPAGSQILGIQVTMQGYYQTGTFEVALLQLLNASGTAEGDNKADTASGAFGTGNTNVTFGGPTEEWGLNLTPTMVNDDDFGVQMAVVATQDNCDVFLDFLRMEITYIPPKTITSINVADGVASGGTPVVLTGTGFTGVTDVEFGGVAATSFSVLSDTSITCVAPAGTADATVDIAVFEEDVTSSNTAADNFTYHGHSMGGTISVDGAYTVHKFTATELFQFNGPATVGEVLVVAGGGGAGNKGGGGGGGYLAGAETLSGCAMVTVGAGGIGGDPYDDNPLATKGKDSVFMTRTAIGGGQTTRDGPFVGGSGGGGQHTLAGAAGTEGQGYAGGNGASASNGGGGGGAAAVGTNATSTSGGNGGAGVNNDIVLTGTDVGYAGGGGGTRLYTTGTAGVATHGGGNGGPCGSGSGSAGSVNTGGGGGGASGLANGQTGGAGGSGIVVIRYPTPGGSVGILDNQRIW